MQETLLALQHQGSVFKIESWCNGHKENRSSIAWVNYLRKEADNGKHQYKTDVNAFALLGDGFFLGEAENDQTTRMMQFSLAKTLLQYYFLK